MRTMMVWLVCALLLPLSAQAEVKGAEVQYRAGDNTVLRGYVAYDDAVKGKRPGVLVVHEWWGHNEYARKRADMLAALGYTALAVDMYGEGRQAAHPEDAGKFAGALRQNLPLAKARFLAALEVLGQQFTVDADRIAAIGYCFGGAVVLQMAREGVDLKGVASFHGSLDTDRPAQPGTVKAKILVAHGGADPFIPPEHITGFFREMNEAGADYRFIVYGGAKHSFTNPQADQYGAQFKLPLQYNVQADAASWTDLQAFFGRIFANP